MLRLVSRRRSPSTLYPCSSVSRMRWISSSVRSFVRLVGSSCAAVQIFCAVVLPIPYRYCSEVSICFSRGRSTPAIRAIYESPQPCRCLWRGFAVQITRTTPLRRITLHFTQIFFTEARTFTASSSRREHPGIAFLPPAPPTAAISRRGQPGTKGPRLVTAGRPSVKERAGPSTPRHLHPFARLRAAEGGRPDLHRFREQPRPCIDQGFARLQE